MACRAAATCLDTWRRLRIVRLSVPLSPRDCCARSIISCPPRSALWGARVPRRQQLRFPTTHSPLHATTSLLGWGCALVSLWRARMSCHRKQHPNQQDERGIRRSSADRGWRIVACVLMARWDRRCARSSRQVGRKLRGGWVGVLSTYGEEDMRPRQGRRLDRWATMPHRRLPEIDRVTTSEKNNLYTWLHRDNRLFQGQSKRKHGTRLG